MCDSGLRDAAPRSYLEELFQQDIAYGVASHHFSHSVFVQDFVKWRGALFQKFTWSLVDDSPAVRLLAEFLLRDTLATKVGAHQIITNYPAFVYWRSGLV